MSEKQIEKQIKVGDSVVVMGKLHTTIEKIEKNEEGSVIYWFRDEDGMKWNETEDVIEITK